MDLFPIQILILSLLYCYGASSNVQDKNNQDAQSNANIGYWMEYFTTKSLRSTNPNIKYVCMHDPRGDGIPACIDENLSGTLDHSEIIKTIQESGAHLRLKRSNQPTPPPPPPGSPRLGRRPMWPGRRPGRRPVGQNIRVMLTRFFGGPSGVFGRMWNALETWP